MRSQNRRVRRPWTYDEFDSESVVQPISNRNFEQVLRMTKLKEVRNSLRDVSLKERRKEAKRPLYLVRYE